MHARLVVVGAHAHARSLPHERLSCLSFSWYEFPPAVPHDHAHTRGFSGMGFVFGLMYAPMPEQFCCCVVRQASDAGNLFVLRSLSACLHQNSR